MSIAHPIFNSKINDFACTPKINYQNEIYQKWLSENYGRYYIFRSLQFKLRELYKHFLSGHLLK